MVTLADQYRKDPRKKRLPLIKKQGCQMGTFRCGNALSCKEAYVVMHFHNPSTWEVEAGG
jgi:hypothetical protein